MSDPQTCEQIASTWNRCEYLLDPHSAIGVRAAQQAGAAPGIPVVTLATAHPAKFPEAVERAGIAEAPTLPLHLKNLFQREERMAVLPNDLQAVQAFMANNINA